MKNINFKQLGLVLSSVFLGFFLRFYRLGNWGFALDEDYTIYFSKTNWLGDNSNVFMPVHFAVTQFSMFLFGENFFGARIFSAFAGSLTIFILFYFSRKKANLLTGIISVFFLAIHPFHVSISQSCRYLSLATFFSFISFVFYFNAQERKKIIWWVFWIFLVLLATFTFFPCILIFFFPFFERGKYFFKNISLYKISYLIIASLFLFLFSLPIFNWWSNVEKSILQGGPFRFLGSTLFKIDPIIVISSLLGFFLWKEIPKIFKNVFLYLCANFLLFYILSWFGPVNNRYYLWTLPLWIMFSSTLISLGLYKKNKRYKLICFALIFLFFVSSFIQLWKYFERGGFGREGYREAIETTVGKMNKNENLVLKDLLMIEWILPKDFKKEKIIPFNHFFSKNVKNIPKEKTWVILFEDFRKNLIKSTKENLQKNCLLVEKVSSPAQFVAKYYEIYSCIF